MIQKSEKEVMEKWPDDMNCPSVTIRCITYNHEEYISRALDSFLAQETNFPFEVLVHDDASTDRTAEIINEYYKAFPHIIHPIYETENQFSKHDGSIGRVLRPYYTKKYIALCEGDDYWTCNSKLQKQFDYMEMHPECSMVVHNTLKHDLSGKESDKLFNNSTGEKILDGRDVYLEWTVHLSSYFLRTEVLLSMPNFASVACFGDIKLLAWAYHCGTVFYIPKAMSTYNCGTKTSVTKELKRSSQSNRIRYFEDRIKFLEKYDAVTNKEHRDWVEKGINKFLFEKELCSLNYRAAFEKNNWSFFCEKPFSTKIIILLKAAFPFLRNIKKKL